MISSYLLLSSLCASQLDKIWITFFCGIRCVELLFNLPFKELDFISKVIDLLLVLRFKVLL